MSLRTAPVSLSAAEMRREFDDSFAAPIPESGANRESLITIRAAGEKFAVRAAHITGLAKLRRIARLPGVTPGLLGITALRGILFPAYDLATVLGLSAGGNEHAWIMFAACETPVGLVFDHLEGQVEIDRAALYESDRSESRALVRQVAHIGATQYAVIHVPGLIEEIRKRAGLAEPAKGVILP